MAKNMLKWRQKGRPSKAQTGEAPVEDLVAEGDVDSKTASQPKKRWFERRATRNKDIEAAQAQRRRSTSMPDPRAKGGLLKYVEAKQAEVQQSDSRFPATNLGSLTGTSWPGESAGAAHARHLEFYTGGGASARSVRGPTRGAGGRNSRTPEDALDSDTRRKRNAKRLVRQTSSKGVSRGRGKAKERPAKDRSSVRSQPKLGPSQPFGASGAEDDTDKLRVTHTLRKQCETVSRRVNFDRRPKDLAPTSQAAAIACIQAVIRGFLARKAHASALQHEFENYMERIHEEGLRLIVYQKKRKGKISAEERGDVGTPIAELVTVEHIKGQLSLTWGGRLKLQISDQRQLFGVSDVHRRLDQGRSERSARVGGKAQRLRDVHRIIVGGHLPKLLPLWNFVDGRNSCPLSLPLALAHCLFRFALRLCRSEFSEMKQLAGHSISSHCRTKPDSVFCSMVLQASVRSLPWRRKMRGSVWLWYVSHHGIFMCRASVFLTVSSLCVLMHRCGSSASLWLKSPSVRTRKRVRVANRVRQIGGARKINLQGMVRGTKYQRISLVTAVLRRTFPSTRRREKEAIER